MGQLWWGICQTAKGSKQKLVTSAACSVHPSTGGDPVDTRLCQPQGVRQAGLPTGSIQNVNAVIGPPSVPHSSGPLDAMLCLGTGTRETAKVEKIGTYSNKTRKVGIPSVLDSSRSARHKGESSEKEISIEKMPPGDGL